MSIVPWSETWSRLLEADNFGPREAIRATDHIITSLMDATCPGCGAMNLSPTRWVTSRERTDTVVCLTCQIVWPPLEVLKRWDFGAYPDNAPMMGQTIREISSLARSIQK